MAGPVRTMLPKGLPPGKVIKVAALQASVRPAHPRAEVDSPDPAAGQVAARPFSFHEAEAEVADLPRAQEARKDKELMRSGGRSESGGNASTVFITASTTRSGTRL